jgi:hypothetical protein
MKLFAIFLLLCSLGLASPRATLTSAEELNRAIDAKLPKSAVEGTDTNKLLEIRLGMEKIRRLAGRIEAKWSFSRWSTTKREVVESNRVSTVGELRTLNEIAEALVIQVREFVPESKRAGVEESFKSLREAIAAYEKQLQEGRYP